MSFDLAIALSDGGFQFFSSRKLRDFMGFDLYGFSGTGVAPRSGFALGDFEGAKTR